MTGTFDITYHHTIFDKDIELVERIEREVTAVNRERKLDSILEDKEYIPYTAEETQIYKDWIRMYEYSEYINKQLEDTINYSEYIAEQLYMQIKI